MASFRTETDRKPAMKRFNEWIDSWRGIFMLLFLSWMGAMLYFTIWYADSSFTRSQAFIGAEEVCSSNGSGYSSGYITSLHTITYCYNLSSVNEEAIRDNFLRKAGRCVDSMWLEFANLSCKCNAS